MHVKCLMKLLIEMLFSAYPQVGDCCAGEAFRVAQDMQREELEPNRVTLVGLFQAASNQGKSILGYAIRRGISWINEVFETSLMDMHMKCGLTDKVVVNFSKMSRKTVGSWNALITGHLQLGQLLRALELFIQMVQENYVSDLITLANGLLSCGCTRHLAGGKSIHGYFLSNGVQLGLVATTVLIDMYSKCNCLIQAKEVSDKIESKEIVSFNVMISGYIENGFSSKAVELFREMVRRGLKPNISTILNVLIAFSFLKDARQGKCMHECVQTWVCSKYRNSFNLLTCTQSAAP
ncbi:hypothetical protein ACH5RR_002759 [Cinchona calisaya]|uniref:Pentatricopeptide repeat-containing protein n=1 Tax=Cinchona calisaya TaxID=153742 RepID=A0ABD3AT09_9GENT